LQSLLFIFLAKCIIFPSDPLNSKIGLDKDNFPCCAISNVVLSTNLYKYPILSQFPNILNCFKLASISILHLLYIAEKVQERGGGDAVDALFAVGIKPEVLRALGDNEVGML